MCSQNYHFCQKKTLPRLFINTLHWCLHKGLFSCILQRSHFLHHFPHPAYTSPNHTFPDQLWLLQHPQPQLFQGYDTVPEGTQLLRYCLTAELQACLVWPEHLDLATLRGCYTLWWPQEPTTSPNALVLSNPGTIHSSSGSGSSATYLWGFVSYERERKSHLLHRSHSFNNPLIFCLCQRALKEFIGARQWGTSTNQSKAFLICILWKSRPGPQQMYFLPSHGPTLLFESGHLVCLSPSLVHFLIACTCKSSFKGKPL